MSRKLPLYKFRDSDTLQFARKLIGKVLCTRTGKVLTSGIIIETEAYLGETDRASHAFGGRNTERTSVMYEAGGIAYVYLCYGIHSLFNVVTHSEGVPHAILIRGVQPLDGFDNMLKRRGLKKVAAGAFSGPGKVTQSLGITLSHNRTSLTGNKIWIEDRGIIIEEKTIIATPRIGVDYAGKDALLPYRFVVSGTGPK